MNATSKPTTLPTTPAETMRQLLRRAASALDDVRVAATQLADEGVPARAQQVAEALSSDAGDLAGELAALLARLDQHLPGVLDAAAPRVSRGR